MAVLGHGSPIGEPQKHKGLVDGLDVLWVTKDYPLAAILWQTEIAPRFRGLQGVKINESEHTVRLPNNAQLWVRSAEAIQGVRGIGKNLGGCVCSEAAHWDLETALKDVILPALLDNQGWLLCESTTYAGSYFNQIAQEIRAGADSRAQWKEFYHTARDNPRLGERAIAALEAEYPEDSDALRQEVYAELIEGGAGLAFPNWGKIHQVKAFDPPPHWRAVAGLDWGITEDSVCLLGLVDQDKRCLISYEWTWRDMDAYEAGYSLAQRWMGNDAPWPEQLWCDSAMNTPTGVGGTTIYGEFEQGFADATRGMGTPQVIICPAPKGPGSRAQGYNLVRKMLDWGPPLLSEDGTEYVPASRYPRLRVVKDRCPLLCRTLPVLKLHPEHRDDVDNRPGHKQQDHAFDALRYMLAGCWPQAQAPKRDVPQDRHPGFLPNFQRRKRERTPEVEREEALIVADWRARQSGVPLGGKFGRSVRRMMV